MFRGRVDQANWNACKRVFDEADYSNVLMNIYADGDVIAEAVLRASKENNVSSRTLWRALHDAELRFAVIRGLVDDH